MKLALIGCGNIAKFHIEAFNSLGVNIDHCASSLNSSTINKFADKYKIPNVWADPIKLAKAQNVWDGIIICTPTKFIPRYLEILLEFRKPILVEKPVSIGIDYLKKFKTHYPKYVQVAYNRRFYHTVNYAKNFIENSRGKHLCKLILPEKVIDNKNKTKRFEKIYENSAHGIDLLFYLFKSLKIEYVTKLNLNSFDSSRIAILRTKDNHKCIIIFNSNSPDNFSIEIENGKQRILLSPFEKVKLFEGLKKIDPSKHFPLRTYNPILKFEKDNFQFDMSTNRIKPGFYEQSKDFLNLILNKKTKNFATLKDAYKVQELINKIM